MDRPIIVALDFNSEEAVFSFLQHFHGKRLFVKVGMELFYSLGPNFLEKLKDAGHHIFLDLKLHDIPNTVHHAMKVLAKQQVDIVNVHAAGGSKMMKAAREGLEVGTPSGQKRPALIAVTQLTSTSETMMNSELRIAGSLKDTVKSYASLTEQSGLDGVVCSPLEVPLIKEVCSPSFLTVTPGIRLLGDEKGDQTRVTTPKQARELGSWGIVVGRTITKSETPVLAYENVKKEWSESE
ncbi:orotidine-5'-phosphate decarboxylase [Alkalihalobacillus sp. LMS39]|uniref:orotidine-5'-phosphate decarboxylase n=1 Tax=Alkalihalobacillus sp. LMS39 TaxID=2924032 RepID=UPI001FB3A46E|nr:orotidine-5'-phosphate decarboxylase [Alkalihalobacillus sp. LMS39]UOE92899.1 orotidine-5'-phosphate decarboxylase [Alkalihalobacillus sp. LMS39]